MDFGAVSQKSGTALYAGQDWQLVERKTVTEALTSYAFSNLTGDSETEYRLISYVKNGYAGGVIVKLNINADSTAGNYGYQMTRGVNTTASASRDTGATPYLGMVTTDSSRNVSLSDVTISAKTGTIRVGLTKLVGCIAGTDIYNIDHHGWAWNNSANEITSLSVVADQTGGLGVGTDLFLFARRLGGSVATAGQRFGTMNIKGTLSAGMFVLKERYEVTGSAVTSKTFSGLTGNTNPIYLIKARFVDKDGVDYFLTQLNADSGSNYGWQEIAGVNTTVSAARATGRSSFRVGSAGTDGQISISETILYAKSGNARVGITEFASGISTTTVTNIKLQGEAWSNTTDEITSLVITPSANKLGVGTVIELYQLQIGV